MDGHKFTLILGSEHEAEFKKFHELGEWYKYQEALEDFSICYPDTLFCLEHEGELIGEHDRVYAKNGKSMPVTPELHWRSHYDMEIKLEEVV